MKLSLLKYFRLSLSSLLLFMHVHAQPPDPAKDTFFLAKKKGLIGLLGRELNRQPGDEIVNDVNPFMRFKGKVIRSIEIIPMGLHEGFIDPYRDKVRFSERVADMIHRDTRKSIIRKNLFFKEGQRLLPLSLSDNAKFLREQEYLKDALILVMNSRNSQDSVDVTVIAWDVFPLGGNMNLGSDYLTIEGRDENILGRGNQLMLKGMYDLSRNPAYGFGAGFINRNVRSRFFDISTGFSSFNNSYSSGNREEVQMYTSVDKPLVSRYTEWTGGLDLEYRYSRNAYHSDSLFQSDYTYSFGKIDLWGGYNFGWRRERADDNEKRLRHFIAARFFINHFDQVPGKYRDVYYYRYADDMGFLLSYTLFRQNYHRTNFVLGFGRSEDVPSGLNVTFTGGWTQKQQRERIYLGMQTQWNRYRKTGSFLSPGLRVEGYSAGGRPEDITVLMSLGYFSRLGVLNDRWLIRHFITSSYTRQIRPTLNAPLFLKSDFGIRYYTGDTIQGTSRMTVRYETVFINLTKILGFRFAPFGFAEMTTMENDRFEVYPALGAGVRTRNENLTLGTIELRGFYFPNAPGGLRDWRVELRSNLKFRLSSKFVNKPDVIIFN